MASGAARLLPSAKQAILARILVKNKPYFVACARCHHWMFLAALAAERRGLKFLCLIAGGWIWCKNSENTKQLGEIGLSLNAAVVWIVLNKYNRCVCTSHLSGYYYWPETLDCNWKPRHACSRPRGYLQTCLQKGQNHVLVCGRHLLPTPASFQLLTPFLKTVISGAVNRSYYRPFHWTGVYNFTA